MIPLGLIFLGVGARIYTSQPFARWLGLVFVALGATLTIAGVIWAFVRWQRRRSAQATAWTAPVATQSQVIQPNTLIPTGLPDPQSPVQGYPYGSTVVTTSGASIDRALIQQLTQVGMAIADQFGDPPFAVGHTTVTVMPPVVIDARASAAQLAGGAIAGRATIRQVRDLGMAMGDQRLYELELEVQPDGREAYPVTHRLMVSAAAAGRLALGASLPVQVSAAAPSQIVVDLDGA